MSAPQHRPAARAATNDGLERRARPAAQPDSVERQRIRWFVAGHVGAVTLVYLIAAWVGDGWAPPPFPPDLTAAQRQRLLAPAAGAPLPGPSTAPQAAPTAGPVTAVDLAAPWHQAVPEPTR
jgi:hypothetical protein